jgi:hypothetical protein
LGVTFTKIHAWALTQYAKCVFLDADTLPLRNVDELFDRPDFSAAADVGWPDCFNSGVFVFTPSTATHAALLAFADAQQSFDGGDQGLLNKFFPDWAELPAAHSLSFTYNMTANPMYGYRPAFDYYGDNIKIVHFIGAHKPWHSSSSSNSSGGGGGGGGAGTTSDALVSFLRAWHDMHQGYQQQRDGEAAHNTLPCVATPEWVAAATTRSGGAVALAEGGVGSTDGRCSPTASATAADMAAGRGAAVTAATAIARPPVPVQPERHAAVHAAGASSRGDDDAYLSSRSFTEVQAALDRLIGKK